MDSINELKGQAYEIATESHRDGTYNYTASTRTTAMIAYALLTIAEKLTMPNDKEAT